MKLMINSEGSMRCFFKGKGFLLSFLAMSFVCLNLALSSPAIRQGAVDFDVNLASKKIDALLAALPEKTKNIPFLKQAIVDLTDLQDSAKACAENSEKKLNDINGRWEGEPLVTEVPLSAYGKHLKARREMLSEKNTSCRLFILRSEEGIMAYSAALNQRISGELFNSQRDFPGELMAGKEGLKKSGQQFRVNLFMDQSGLSVITLWSFSFFLLALLVAAFFGFVVQKRQRRLSQCIQVETYSDQIKLILRHVAGKYAKWVFVAIVMLSYSVFLSFLSWRFVYLASTAIYFFALIFYLLMVDLFFYPFQPGCALSGISDRGGRNLAFRLSCFGVLCFVGGFIFLVFKNQDISIHTALLARTIFITLLIISVVRVLWLVTEFPRFLRQHSVFRGAVNFLMTCLLIGLVALEWLGYLSLVTYFLRGIVLSLAAGFVAWLINRLVLAFVRALSSNEMPWRKNIYDQLGLKRHEHIPELFWLRAIILILIWGGFLLLLVKIWVFSPANFDNVLEVITDGFRIGGAHIIPSRIFSGMMFFIILFVFIRWIRHFIERQEGEGVEPASQQAIASIVAYVGTAIILLISLLIAGVNFAGLAIIAGALSVGIGFGLQDIFNNFLSGLVLLIERPIKPGDRIEIDGQEGYVKKINIRSTQLETLDFSDIIIPNSEIISKKVTNLMFHDFYGRVKVEVGIAYGSDTDLAKELLLKVAAEHPEVVHDDKLRQPIVLFRSFDDSSLKFVLSCVIKNVNLKYQVISELNFATDKKFRENGITIAFPQRDIHVKDWTGVTDTKLKSN
jgi:small-conductance mechanosensitive channel